MQGVSDFFLVDIRIMKDTVADPVFFVLVAITLIVGLRSSWFVGIASILVLAFAATALRDWREFVPGLPPSSILPNVFAGTLFLLFAVLAITRVLRAVRNARGLAN